MLRIFGVFFILVVSLYALSNEKILKRADSFMKSGSKSEYFRAYNDYKNLYLRAIVGDNKKLKIASLKGIIKSGNALHIDVSDYADELSKMKPKRGYAKKNLKKNKKKSLKSFKKPRVSSSRKLNSFRWSSERLILRFDKPLTSREINYFKHYDSKTGKYKYVLEVHASMLKSSNTLVKNGIDKIKLLQYNTNTIRVVIQNSEKLNVRFKKDAKELVITIKKPKKVIKSSSKTKKVKHKAKIKQHAYITSPRIVNRNKVIVIDAGHGGKDPGAIGYRRYREKVIVYNIARELKHILRKRGYRVYMTREGDRFVKLSNRTKYANRKKADIFVSIHANAVGKKHAKEVEGIETYFLSPSRSDKAEKVAALENSADLSDMNMYGKNTFLNFLNHHKILASNKLAIDLQRGMLNKLKNYNVHDGGVREGPFWVLVGAQMPAVLVEVGFISHPKEASRLVNKKYQKTLALGLANGIERYFANNAK